MLYHPEKNIVNDFTARSHMMRLEKARNDVKIKYEKQFFQLKIKKNIGKYKRMTSVSADNSILYVKI